MTVSLAKYPFLDGAGEYLRKSGFNWEELEKPHAQHIIENAVERVETALEGRIYEKCEREEVEILTFFVSIIIMRSIGIESLMKKYALAEARRAEKFLIEDIKDRKESERQDTLKVFYDLFRLKTDIADGNRFVRIKIIDYLIRAIHFHEQEWKLINRLTHGGYVYLDSDEVVRLIRSELAVMIHHRLKVMILPEIPLIINTKAEELRNRFSSNYSSNTHVITDYPPCIKHAVEIMNKGENLPHSGRVMLATYMLAIGKSIEDVISLFQNAPDFNERITRYQVEHLAGTKGSHTKYSVPSCEKIRNNNLCFATADCAGIYNPIQFGRKIKNNDTTRNGQD